LIYSGQESYCSVVNEQKYIANNKLFNELVIREKCFKFPI